MKLRFRIFGVLFVFILLVVMVSANPFITLGMQGMQAAVPAAGPLISAAGTVTQVAGCAATPMACVVSFGQGQVLSGAMGELTKAAPEAAKILNTYNQVNGQIKLGAEIIDELQVNEAGVIESGSIKTTGNKNVDFNSFFNEGVNVSGKGVGVDKKDGISKITFNTGGSLEINGNKFEKVAEGSTMELDENGNIKSANLTAGDATNFSIGARNISVGEGSQVLMENGEITVKSDESFNISSGNYSASIFPVKDGIKIRNDGVISGEGRLNDKYDLYGDVRLSKDGYTLIGPDTAVRPPSGIFDVGGADLSANELNIQGRDWKQEKFLSQMGTEDYSVRVLGEPAKREFVIQGSTKRINYGNEFIDRLDLAGRNAPMYYSSEYDMGYLFEQGGNVFRGGLNGGFNIMDIERGGYEFSLGHRTVRYINSASASQNSGLGGETRSGMFGYSFEGKLENVYDFLKKKIN